MNNRIIAWGLFMVLFSNFVFAQVPETNSELPALEEPFDFQREFDLEMRSMDLRFRELQQDSEKRNWGVVGGIVVVVVIGAFGYRDILKKAKSEVQEKVSSEIDEKLENELESVVTPRIQRAVRMEIRERINDLNRAATHFAFQEQVRKEQSILAICYDEGGQQKMRRLLTNLRFENIRTALANDRPSFRERELVIFVKHHDEMKEDFLEDELNKPNEDILFIYYGPYGSNVVRQYPNRITASNNRHTLFDRIMEAVRFRDDYFLGPEDELITPKPKEK